MFQKHSRGMNTLHSTTEQNCFHDSIDNHKGIVNVKAKTSQTMSNSFSQYIPYFDHVQQYGNSISYPNIFPEYKTQKRGRKKHAQIHRKAGKNLSPNFRSFHSGL